MLFGAKNFALSLVLKQSFENSKEADPCGPFIRSIELKTEFFFDVTDDVIDEILEVFLLKCGQVQNTFFLVKMNFVIWCKKLCT